VFGGREKDKHEATDLLESFHRGEMKASLKGEGAPSIGPPPKRLEKVQ